MRYAIPDWRMLENWCTRRSSCFYGLGEKLNFGLKLGFFLGHKLSFLDHWISHTMLIILVAIWFFVTGAEGLGYRMEQNRMSTIMVVKILIWILWFYDLTWPKRFRSFKDLCNCSGLVGLYNSNDLKRSLFLVIFFNLT